MLCGSCLKSRYGQNIREVLMDSKWQCPPCLDICNCSICLAKNGEKAIPYMTQEALSEGFASVHHWLQSKKYESFSNKKD